MKTPFKLGLLGAVSLVAGVVFAAGAHADHGAGDIHPDNTTIRGTADFPTLDYEGVLYQCNTGTATGRTNTDSDVVNVELEFFGNCNINGVSFTVTCSDASDPNTGDDEWDEVGTARLHALNPTTNEGRVDRLNPGFRCDMEFPGVCIITFAAQELPSDVDGSTGRDQADLLNEGAETPPNPVDDTISGLVDVEASRTGSSLCGPTQGDFAINADYALNTNVSFDAP